MPDPQPTLPANRRANGNLYACSDYCGNQNRHAHACAVVYDTSKREYLLQDNSMTEHDDRIEQLAQFLYASWCKHAHWDIVVTWERLLDEYKTLWRSIATDTLNEVVMNSDRGIDA